MGSSKGMRVDAWALVTAAVLIWPGAAAATSFTVVDSQADSVTVLDSASIRWAAQGAVRRAWSVSVKKALTNGGSPQPGYVRTLNEYDCIGRHVRWKTFQAYTRFGDLVMKQDNTDDLWKTAPQTGEMAVALRLVCEGSNGESVISAPSIGQLVLTLMQGWDQQAAPTVQASDPPAKKPATGKAKARKARS